MDLSKGYIDNTGNIWTASGNPVIKDTSSYNNGLIKKAMYFDGNSYLQSGADASSNPIHAEKEFTEEVWVLPIDGPSDQYDAAILSEGVWNYTDDHKVSINAQQFDGKQCEIPVYIGDYYTPEPGTFNKVQLNTWHRIILTRNSYNVFELCIDGVWNTLCTRGFTIGDTSYLHIANKSDPRTNKCFTGYIYLCRATNKLIYTKNNINEKNWTYYEPDEIFFTNILRQY